VIRYIFLPQDIVLVEIWKQDDVVLTLTRYTIRALALTLLVATIILCAIPILASQYINGVLIETGYHDPYSTITNQKLIDIVINTYHRINISETFKLMYVRIYVLNINGMDIVYSKYMGNDGNKSKCYYTRIVIENGKVVNMSVKEMILGVDIDDPIVVNTIFTTQRSTETTWTIEAIVKSIIMLGINITDFKRFSIAFAEIISPQDKLLSVVYVLDNHAYGVIYDWSTHKIVRAGLNIIRLPINILSLQKSRSIIPLSLPTLPLTSVTVVEKIPITITKVTPSTTTTILVRYDSKTITTKSTPIRTLSSMKTNTRTPTPPTIAIAGDTTIITRELSTMHTIVSTTETISREKYIPIIIVVLSAITVTFATFIILKRIFT